MRPFSRTSKMVTWLTRDYGLITTPVKGALRPKSNFLGQIDVGYLSELLFYEFDHDGVHNIRETTPIDFRRGLRDNWRAAIGASYICMLTSQSVTGAMDAQALFDDLDDSLTKLAQGAVVEDVIVGYEIILLTRLGLCPNFEPCRECVREGNDSHNCRFMISSGHLGCFDHPAFILDKDSVALSGGLLKGLRSVFGGEKISSLPKDMAYGVRRFLGMFISHHIDISLYSRRTTFAWLDL